MKMLPSNKMKKEAKDFSYSQETLWMKEQEPGQFYKLYVNYSIKSHRGVLEVSSQSSREFLGEDPSLLDKKTFYKRVGSMTDDVRTQFLRRMVVGYDVAIREAEARVSDFLDNNPLEEVVGSELGERIADAFIHGMGIKKDND